MIDKKMAELFAGVNAINAQVKAGELIGPEGKEAAILVLKLMQETVNRLPPLEVVEVWADSKGRGKWDKMWDALGPRTIESIASGCHTLAVLWQSAWRAGGGGQIPVAELVEIDQQVLMDLYNNKQFVPSYTLSDERFKRALE